MPELKRRYPDLTNYRWHALKLLESDKEVCSKYPVNLPDVLDRSYESDIINQKYDFIGEVISEVLLHKQRQDVLTEDVYKRQLLGPRLLARLCAPLPGYKLADFLQPLC